MFTTWCTWRQYNTVHLKICEEGKSHVGYLLFTINWIFLSLLSTVYLSLPPGSNRYSHFWSLTFPQRADSWLALSPHPSLSSPWHWVPWAHLEGTQQKLWVNNPIILIFHLYWLTLGGKAQPCLTNAFKLLPSVLLKEWRHSYKYFKA